jgi:hypothetical protein
VKGRDVTTFELGVSMKGCWSQSVYCTWQVIPVLYPSDSTVMLDGVSGSR